VEIIIEGRAIQAELSRDWITFEANLVGQDRFRAKRI